MSSIKLTADSGGGTVELKAPATTGSNAAKIITLPGDADGTIARTDDFNLVKLSTTTVSSAVGQVDFDIDAATYTQALIFIEGMQLSSDSNLYARFKIGGTIQTGNTYVAETVKKHAGGFDSAQYGGANQSYMYLTNNIGGDTNESYSGQFRLNLGSGTGSPMLTINSLYRDNASAYAVNFGSAGWQNFNTVNGIRFYTGANIDAGKFTLYGIK
tara:strand:- start:52 stop:693 length:642 start_codon:yes stop_codon:yes gene_type:complete